MEMSYKIPTGSQYLGETIDEREGDYFVSAVDGGRFWLLAGPYPTHRLALDMVETVRQIAKRDPDPREAFVGYGTCRLEEGSGRVGACQRVGLLPEHREQIAA
jgi:hypothetical protein